MLHPGSNMLRTRGGFVPRDTDGAPLWGTQCNTPRRPAANAHDPRSHPAGNYQLQEQELPGKWEGRETGRL